MRTWLIWLGSAVVLLVLTAIVGAHQTHTTAGLFLGLCFIVWVFAGVLLALRAVLRFLRR